jgi:hypothetical protein
MNLKNDEERLIRRYLLGELSEEETLRVEERFFTNRDFYEQILAVENELKYDYGQGHLSSQERQSFESRFLESSESRRRAEMTGVLLKEIAEAAPHIDRRPSDARVSRLAQAFRLRNPALQYALVALVLVMAGTSAWFIYRTAHLRAELERAEVARVNGDEQMERLLTEERARSEQLAQELERERNKPGSSPGPTEKPPLLGTIASIALTPGIERDGGKVKKLRLAPEVEQLRIQLDVRAEGEYESFRASLQTADGDEIWSRARLKAKRTPSGRFIFLTIDVSVLVPGDYVIILKGTTADHPVEEAGDYYLTILRK